MSFFTTDRFLLIALCLGFGTAYVAVPALLQQVKHAAKAPAAPEAAPPRKRLQQDSENSLKIGTLRTLADGYSHDLRTSAMKVVVSRTVRSRARDLLLRDLASKSYHRRQDAINALNMLLTNNSLNGTPFNQFRDAKSITAVVKALINVLPQHWQHNIKSKTKNAGQPDDQKTRLPPSPVRPKIRPPQEGYLLSFLSHMLQGHSRRGIQYTSAMDAALRVGIVTKWLANYPFPCSQPENVGFNYKRSDIARLFDRMAWMSDDPAMADVILSVMQYPLGRKQMRQVGLSASSYKENVNMDHRDHDSWNAGWGSPGWAEGDEDDEDDEDRDVRMVNGEDTAGLLPVPDNITLWEEPLGRPTTRAGARLRSAERSQEEEHLRRRHREAIVVAERGAPLTRQNILQREGSQILQPMNEISEVEGALNGLLGLSENRTERQEGATDRGYITPSPVYETEQVLDPVAEGEVEREMRELEVEVETEEARRAQEEALLD